jgi:hypothetical protein
MSEIPAAAWIAEGALLALLALALRLIWKKTPRLDRGLWIVLWVIRAGASLVGARHAARTAEDLAVYLGLQSAAALLLAVAMVRAELRACREKLAAHVRDQIQWW